jgi:predicted enzyme related to lactoylglutathione lyase
MLAASGKTMRRHSVDWKLELVVVPVSDVDRAKAFYLDQAGFVLDVDHRAGEDFRVVQVTPPGSACSVAIMKNAEAPGSLQGLHLVVTDIDAARAELVGRGVDVSDVFHFGPGGQAPGPDPERRDHATFLSFSDPDGNGWLVQEVGRARSGTAG